jgi:ADP-ribosylation factor related protein 1
VPQFSLVHGFVKWLIATDEARLLIIGLDGAGKTTYLDRVKAAFNRGHIPAPLGAIPPTRGMNLFKVGVSDLSVTMWDVGGLFRDMWGQYYAEADALVFCIDAADRTRFADASAALADALEMTHGPVLILANKQDEPAAARASEIQEAVCTPAGLPPGGRVTKILEIAALQSATDGSARASIEWLVSAIPRG